MDAYNRFHTRATYTLVRGDYLAVGALLLWQLIAHRQEVEWARFAAAFAWIDLVGYLPGALWYRYRARGGRDALPPLFVALYNFAHSIALNLALVLAWRAVSGSFEWAMVAAPIHLCIDRGFFGNIYKTTKLSFEPVPHPEFASFALALERDGSWPGTEPSRHSSLPPSDIDDVVRRYADHPSIGLVFNKDTQYFTKQGLTGFIAYRRRGRAFFCIGGPVGDAQGRGELLEQFMAFVRRERGRVVALQVREPDVDLFHRSGFRLNQMGRSYTLRIADFSLAGGRFMKLRNKIKQPLKAGVTIRELTGSSNAQLVRELDRVSAAWLHAKGSHVKELRFLVGEVDSVQREGTRCFGAVKDGEIIAFITYVPSYGRYAGYMHDLTRRKPDCPPGTLEAINCHAIETFKNEGIEHLCFGFTPLVGIDDRHPSHSAFLARLFRWMERRAAFIYPAQSQEAYKRKWSPQLIEPEYLAFEGRFALSQLWSFLRLTRAL